LCIRNEFHPCYKLLNSNFGAADGFAGEAANFAGLVGDNTVAVGVDGEVVAELGAFAGALGQANLAYNNLAGADFLAAKELNTEALAAAVACVFGGTACFDV
jgi:hypothetical protein